MALGSGAASPAPNCSEADGSGGLQAAWAARPAARPEPLPPRASASAGVSSAHPWATGERERDQWWMRPSCSGEPSESNIAATLSGERAWPTISQCIGGMPWAVPCGSRERRVLVVAPGGHGPVVINRHWGGTRASHAAHAIVPSPGGVSGPWVRGGRQGLLGEAAPGGPP